MIVHVRLPRSQPRGASPEAKAAHEAWLEARGIFVPVLKNLTYRVERPADIGMGGTRATNNAAPIVRTSDRVPPMPRKAEGAEGVRHIKLPPLPEAPPATAQAPLHITPRDMAPKAPKARKRRKAKQPVHLTREAFEDMLRVDRLLPPADRTLLRATKDEPHDYIVQMTPTVTLYVRKKK
jgi:hypothetical protein